MRDLLRACRPGYGTAVVRAAWGAEEYRNAGVGRLRLVLFGVAAGALDGPNDGVVPEAVEEHDGADRRVHRAGRLLGRAVAYDAVP
ncbi:hypothetical protein ACIRQQ_31485 [Streptomyces fuscichromogenes]|uniref:hypothetical protein n=1 Tax=Streptomyces fuscichromogenes TaxID=1324013 RepID=UPI003821FA33